MKPKRVIIITDLCDPVGGQEVLALKSARLLKEKGVEVVYVCGDSGTSKDLLALDIEVKAAQLSRLLDMPRGKAFRSGVYNTDARAFVERIVKTYDAPDTVFHVHGWAQIFSPSIFSALAPVANRTILHAHDMSLACPNGVYMDFPRSAVCNRRPLSLSCLATQCDKRNYAQKLWRVTRQTVLARCLSPFESWAGIIVIHPQMQPMLQRFGYPDELFHLVRNPASPYLERRVRAEENEAFLFVGRLEQEKGIVELAQAAERVGVPLICVGDGSLKDWLAQTFPNVTLTGRLSGSEIAHWATKSRALVFPSYLPEPFGLVLAEAVHSGLPVAVTQTALMAAEIQDRELGLSFDVTDTASFDGVLRSFRDMSETALREMSQSGFSTSERLGLEEDAWVDGLMDVYEKALSLVSKVDNRPI